MTRRGEGIRWTIVVLASLSAALGWRAGGAPAPVSHDAGTGAPAREVSRADASALTAQAAAVVSRDPFRLERRPASVRFGAAPPAQQAMPAAPRPRLTVTGIFGPPWQAVLEGFPGREGSVVVREGQEVGGLRVRSIRSDTVVIAGADTVWKLVVRRPW